MRASVEGIDQDQIACTVQSDDRSIPTSRLVTLETLYQTTNF